MVQVEGEGAGNCCFAEIFSCGAAGMCVVSMKGALVAFLTTGTAQFQRFFDNGRAVRCLLP